LFSAFEPKCAAVESPRLTPLVLVTPRGRTVPLRGVTRGSRYDSTLSTRVSNARRRCCEYNRRRPRKLQSVTIGVAVGSR